MNNFMKLIFVVVYLLASLEPVQAQGKYDIFPLMKGFQYEYNIYQEYKVLSQGMFLYLLDSDSGKVEYIVKDSLNYSDSLTIWNIDQIRNLLHRHQASKTDTAHFFFINDTSYYQLYEYLTGHHELKCSSMVWSFPYSNVYRYSDYDNFLNIVFNHQYICDIVKDSIWFSCDAGMYKRITSILSNCGNDKIEHNLFVNRIDIPEGVEINKINSVKRFILSQNHPNPFNPTTKIKYQIPESGLVTLKIYDVLGDEISVLINEEKPVGNYEVEFDARRLPSGVYFYQLKAGNYVETKKMVLIK